MKTDRYDRPDFAFIGCQNNWSTLPLCLELEKSASRFKLLRDDGAGLNKKLEQGDVAMAFCPSISLVRHADFEMALPMGVAVEGGSSLGLWGLNNHQLQLKQLIEARIEALRQVFRWAQVQKADNIKQAISIVNKALEDLPQPQLEFWPSLKHSNSSSSWNALSRILYRLIFGADAYDALQRQTNSGSTTWNGVDEEAPSLDLRIENDALQKRCSYRYYFDLGEIWRQITGLPFVSCILQKNRRYSCQFESSLSEVLNRAEMRMQVEPCNYLPDMLPRNCHQQSIDLCSMWKGLHYRLDANHMRGLYVFLALAKPVEKQTRESEEFTLKLLRWQQKEGFLAGSVMANQL